MDDTIAKLLEISPEWLTKRIKENYSFGIAKSTEELEANNHDHLKWANPLEVALPNAPDMKIFCFYGVGTLLNVHTHTRRVMRILGYLW